mmetsp:Transcript_86440/g.241887  ORF Transcript_86440/g.241887 Transcript_86440/m.241887 type:complete len:182 (-) Transcript_86440:138-683(-)
MALERIPSQADTVEAIGPLLTEKGVAYKKANRAFLKKATPGEKVQTILNGKLETENVACEGDLIVRANTTSKERYIIKPDVFAQAYVAEPVDIGDHPDAEELAAEGFRAHVSKRRVLAIEVDDEIMRHFPAGKFMAAWGTPMIVEVGDFLASGASEDGAVREVARIEKTAFAETYVREAAS